MRQSELVEAIPLNGTVVYGEHDAADEIGIPTCCSPHLSSIAL